MCGCTDGRAFIVQGWSMIVATKPRKIAMVGAPTQIITDVVVGHNHQEIGVVRDDLKRSAAITGWF